MFTKNYGNMDVERFRDYCLSKLHVTEGLPFGEDVLVFKVAEKMFALLRIAPKRDGVLEEPTANLKCDPERAVELREKYRSVEPGYHMSKKHWNTIYFNQDLNEKEIKELIDHSYQLIVDKLPKKIKEQLF